MKLGSLFDGIGGFPLAATFHGITPVWASEIEKFPIEVTKARFPNMKHLGDITQINGAEIEPVDIISAGSPCQDLSVAGKREGLSGARSGLFMEFIRIVREMRNATTNQYPRFIIWENVPGAFSSNGGQDFRSVLEEITESEVPMPQSGRWARAGMVRGNGRSAAWRVLDAQYWGVPQRRKRIFLVADFTGQRAGEILLEREGLPGDFAESQAAREEVAAGDGEGVEGARCYDIGEARLRTPSEYVERSPCLSARMGSGGNNVPAVVRMREGCPGGGKGPLVSEDKSLTLGASNDQVLIYENHGQDSRITGPLDVAPTVSQKFGTGGNNTPLVQTAFGPGGQGDVAHALRSQASKADKPDSTTYLLARYKNNVDGVVGDEVTATLRSCGSATHERKIPAMVAQGQAIRRLTPLECERLQGFPDGWTDISGASDTGRYKALGNSVAVPCVAWIMRRIKAATKVTRWNS